MSRKFINPDTLFPSQEYGFSQVVTTEGGRFVHCAGQTAWTKDQQLIGGDDLKAQMEGAFDNVRLALEAAGASLADVVRLHVYIVDYTPENLGIVAEVTSKVFGKETPPASTLLGVQSLALPEFKVEIEATAWVAS